MMIIYIYISNLVVSEKTTPPPPKKKKDATYIFTFRLLSKTDERANIFPCIRGFQES